MKFDCYMITQLKDLSQDSTTPQFSTLTLRYDNFWKFTSWGSKRRFVYCWFSDRCCWHCELNDIDEDTFRLLERCFCAEWYLSSWNFSHAIHELWHNQCRKSSLTFRSSVISRIFSLQVKQRHDINIWRVLWWKIRVCVCRLLWETEYVCRKRFYQCHRRYCYDSSYAPSLIAMLMTMLMTMLMAILRAIADRSPLEHRLVPKPILFRVSLCSSESYR